MACHLLGTKLLRAPKPIYFKLGNLRIKSGDIRIKIQKFPVTKMNFKILSVK